jgi:hypothetical protein
MGDSRANSSSLTKVEGGAKKGRGFNGFRHVIASSLNEAEVSVSATGVITGTGVRRAVIEDFYVGRRILSVVQSALARLRLQVPLSLSAMNFHPLGAVLFT